MPDTGPEKPKDPLDGVSSAYQKAGPYLDASWQLVGATGMWTAIGYFLDRWLHTGPWLLVAGAVLGVALGFYLFFRGILAADKKDKRDKAAR